MAVAAQNAAAGKILAFRPRLAEFVVYPHDAPEQSSVVCARSVCDAAAAFLETWQPAVEAGQDVEIAVIAKDTGEITRLTFDLD